MDKNKLTYTLEELIKTLSVLLILSLIALSGIVTYNHFSSNKQERVLINGNIITPNEDKDYEKDNDLETEDTNRSKDEENQNNSGQASSIGTQSQDIEAFSMSLYKKHPQDNSTFQVINMLPGDKETNYYGVRVSYKDKITVKFRIDVLPEYKKLSEVLRCKILLLSTGEQLYDGLMSGVSDSINHKLQSNESTTTDLYYEICAYLDTEVGNEYQNQKLIADFQWFVDEEDNLVSPPNTGDFSNITLWIGLAAGSLFIFILLKIKHRKETTYE